jgi:hypothetical protein
MFTKQILGATILAFLAMASATAHHSFAVHFVGDEIVSVEGVVTEFRFRNPHGIVRFVARDEHGDAIEWQAETNSPNILRRRGWSESSISAGDQVVIEGYPSRDGSHFLRIYRVIYPDGHVLVGQRPNIPQSEDKD